jgi:DNA-binding NarL/FixJ family response regulator
LNEALAIAQELHDLRQDGLTRRELGRLAREEQQFEYARQCYTETLVILQGLEDRREVAVTRLELGILTVQQGQVEEAESLLTEVLATLRQVEDQHNAAQALKELGRLRHRRQQWEQAAQYWLSAGVGFTLTNAPDRSQVEEFLGQLRAQLGSEALLSTARRVATSSPEPAYGLDQAAWTLAVHQLAASQAHPQLGETTSQAALAEGHIRSSGQALEAGEQPPPSSNKTSISPLAVPASKAPTYPAELTAREVEVLRLVAQGLTDAQVAEQLVISPRTVNWHLTSIYSKIGVTSRSAATRFAIEQHLT